MNVPKLRFKEFNDEYKSIKLKEVSEIYDGTHETPNYVEKGVKFVSVENISNLLDTTKFIPESDYNKYKIKPKYNDVFMTRIGDIGTSSIYKSDEKLAYYVSLALLRTKDNHILIPDYLNQYIKNNSFQKELYNKTIHVAFPKKINTGEIGECSINLCSDKEQLKVSNFLSLLDKKIELQSKKIEDLKLFKKGFIEFEFSNSNYNEINLKEILKERKTYSEKGLEFPHVTLSKDGIYDKSDRYNRDFLVKSDDKKYKITYLNDLCYNPANLKFGVICLNEYGSAIFSPIYVTFVIKNIANPKYIKYYVTRNNFINAIRKYEQGTVYERMAVAPEDFLKFSIKLPNIEIQNKFVAKLSKLDQKIELENLKLSRYIKLKKGLMQNMFV